MFSSVHTVDLVTPTTPDSLFVAALEVVPAEDWCRTWTACRTIMLLMTSKRVREIVVKIRLPAVIRLRKYEVFNTCWLIEHSYKCSIRILDLQYYRVLGRCVTLAHLDLTCNSIGPEGAKNIAKVLVKCNALTHLNLSNNSIGPEGAKSIAGVLGQCDALADLNLSNNSIGPEGAKSIAGVLGQCVALTHLNLSNNWIGSEGATSIAEVLGQCTVLAHLDLSCNWIGPEGAESITRVFKKNSKSMYL
jgi:Ran GTPase-activating protein (RanGAP) involved in mRNA processing and transport